MKVSKIQNEVVKYINATATKDIETDDDINNAITETLEYLKGDV